MIFRLTYHAGTPPSIMMVEVLSRGELIEAREDDLQVVPDQECDCVVCQVQTKTEKEVEGVWHKNVLAERE